MKRYLAAGAAVLAFVVPAVAQGAGSPAGGGAGPAAIAAKSCSAGFVKATIGGQTKCLRRGEYCAVRYKSQYRRYGFTCSGNPARLH